MHTLRLLFEDQDGTLSPLVDEAIQHGATADRDATNVPDNSFNLTFRYKRSADAFAKKLPEWALVGEHVADDDVEVEFEPDVIETVEPKTDEQTVE